MIPPHLALVVWSFLLVLLLRYASDKEAASSPALWVPVIWLSLAGSRSLAQWLGIVPTTAATAFEEGSPIDRAVYLLLIGLGLSVLGRRRLFWREILSRNAVLTSLILFSLASVIWSDFPYIAFKRWIRDLGVYVMILVVLTDPRPIEAISVVIRRVSYVLVIYSVVFIRYYSELGMAYDSWTGAPEYLGVTTSKNMLGILCVLSGLFYFWDSLHRWSTRSDRQSRRFLFVNLMLLAMTLWLLRLSQSATSQGSFVIGCFVIGVVRSKWATVNPGRVKALIPLGLSAYFFLEVAFDLSAIVAEFFGRDPSLHGRTEIWKVVLALQTNPLLGVGYQSFWMGDRLAKVWGYFNIGFLNEAHNGYVETYLNLGLVGLGLLILFLISVYRRVCRQLSTSLHFASFAMGLWTVMLFHNITESSFGASLLWLAMLLCSIDVPGPDFLNPSRRQQHAVKRQPMTV
jgi:O-antigen ligase